MIRLRERTAFAASWCCCDRLTLWLFGYLVEQRLEQIAIYKPASINYGAVRVFEPILANPIPTQGLLKGISEPIVESECSLDRESSSLRDIFDVLIGKTKECVFFGGP